MDFSLSKHLVGDICCVVDRKIAAAGVGRVYKFIRHRMMLGIYK